MGVKSSSEGQEVFVMELTDSTAYVGWIARLDHIAQVLGLLHGEFQRKIWESVAAMHVAVLTGDY